MKVTRTDGNGLPSPASVSLSKVSSGRAESSPLASNMVFHDWCLHLMKPVTWKQRSETSLNLRLSFSRAA